MSDWFDVEHIHLRNEGVEVTGVDEDSFRAVYSWLAEQGLIDYDTEKEVFWNRRMERLDK
jgi:hypothetical protein